jgi:hypothetical protein
LESIDGFDAERATLIVKGAMQLVEELPESDEADNLDDEDSRPTDIDQLILPLDIKEVLVKQGIDSIQRLAEFSPDQLTETTGLRPDEAELVCSATEAFLRVQNLS